MIKFVQQLKNVFPNGENANGSTFISEFIKIWLLLQKGSLQIDFVSVGEIRIVVINQTDFDQNSGMRTGGAIGLFGYDTADTRLHPRLAVTVIHF